MSNIQGDNRHKRQIIIIFACIIATALVFYPHYNVYAENEETSLQIIQKKLDFIWIIVAASMVFFMQVGFTAYEAGSVQAKNAISVSIKNILNFLISSITYFIVGFGIMFGVSYNGYIGISNFLLYGIDTHLTSLGYAFVFIQLVFAGTAATITSGAYAERAKLLTHICTTIVVVCLIYPVFGHWAWGHLLHTQQYGWLERLGFIDFAGSTVVHSVSGWIALSGAIVLGPRTGKFNPDGTVNRMYGHNLPLATIGTFFLWFGWFGFNGGALLQADTSIGLVIINTTLSGSVAGVAAAVFRKLKNKTLDAAEILLGIMGGIVAIGAGCSRVSPVYACIVGLCAGIIAILAKDFIEKILRVDDPVGAVPVHGFCGVWGTLAVSLFTPVSAFSMTNFSRLLQVGVQCLGIIVAFAWAFSLGLLFFWCMKKLVGIRISTEEEVKGLNISEYADVTSWLDFVKITKVQDLNAALQDKIKDRTRELEDIKRNLEEDVKKRTSELEKSRDDFKKKAEQLENFAKVAVGRELKMKKMEEDLYALKKPK
ncbi:ammonium transporter [uncultured Candidatus Kuenenia sp.]|jgi:Amt family ammonium transporter|uniref:ammonium transporter n=1 Tax=uncultured Candidatus Kuenenia sp. TaxID=1048336 RepID=UPI0002DDE333|nr:ammonium transporter [uncultured Candidatus Kuenenia sp.]